MELNPDWSEFVELLNESGVEYLVIGAFALAFHGLPRATGDIDFWVRNTSENAGRLLSALDRFGFSSLGLKAEDFMSPNAVIMLGRPPRRIDLLTGIDGLEFDESWQRRVLGHLGSMPVYFISRDDFVKNKLAAGRPKDLIDAEAVQNANPPGLP